jgi:serine/threonine protein kinase
MSVVWRAEDLLLGRRVAVKVLADTGPPMCGGIWAEARAVARLTHPYVAKVYDYGESTGSVGDPVQFVVMEVLRGVPLARLAEAGPVPPRLALRVCAQVAEALAHAHSRGVVHRDVKPGNVMVTDSALKIFDFGISAPVGAADRDRPGQPVIGTVSYLAPERLVGAPVAPASDVYALGLMLFRLLAYDFPWPAATTSAEIIAAHVFGVSAALPRLPGVSAVVGGLYRRCVAKDPADRPSAHQVASVLMAALDSIPGPDAITVEIGHGERRRSSRTELTVPAPTLAHAYPHPMPAMPNHHQHRHDSFALAPAA